MEKQGFEAIDRKSGPTDFGDQNEDPDQKEEEKLMSLTSKMVEKPYAEARGAILEWLRSTAKWFEDNSRVLTAAKVDLEKTWKKIAEDLLEVKAWFNTNVPQQLPREGRTEELTKQARERLPSSLVYGRVVIRKGWGREGRCGVIIGPLYWGKGLQYWVPVMWDNESRPSWFQDAGLEAGPTLGQKEE